MKAYLIDPKKREVTEVEHDGDFKQIYKFIDADCFDAVAFNEHRDYVFVDDEGLLKNPEYFFHIRGCSHPLAGKGLVLGTNDEGESTDPTVPFDDFKASVSFDRLKVEGFVTTEKKADVLGAPGTHITTRTVFSKRE